MSEHLFKFCEQHVLRRREAYNAPATTPCPYCAIATLTAERDALRAEVEELKAENEMLSAQNGILRTPTKLSESIRAQAVQETVEGIIEMIENNITPLSIISAIRERYKA
jgi:hypothetical protein